MKSILQAVMKMPDSAPGIHGIPYSAWRVCPLLTASIFKMMINLAENDSWNAVYGAPTKTVLAA